MTVALRGRVVTDYEVWPDGTVLLEGDRVAEARPEPRAADEVHEYPNHLILPGFVDLQVNGAFGIDAATEPERLDELSRKLLSTGTTSYLPTVISSPRSLYRETLPTLADVMKSGVPGAEPLGVHLEGPFVNVKRRGAHPTEYISKPDAVLLNELLDLAPVCLLTLAPELEGVLDLARTATERGIAVSAGH